MDEDEDILGIDAAPGIVAPNQGTTRARFPGTMAAGTGYGQTLVPGDRHFNAVPIGSRALPVDPTRRAGADPTPVGAHEFQQGARGGCAPVPLGYSPTDHRSTGAIEGREPTPAYVMAAKIAQNRNALPVGLGEWMQHLAAHGRRPPRSVLRALAYHPVGQAACAYAAQLNQYLDAVERGGGRVAQED